VGTEATKLSEDQLSQKIAELTDKLYKSKREGAIWRQKAELLEQQYWDARERERNTYTLVMSLLERQKELNVMLNWANRMLHRTQETMALTSIEFKEIAKALPEPKQKEWEDRIARINELFEKSGVPDAEISDTESLQSEWGDVGYLAERVRTAQKAGIDSDLLISKPLETSVVVDGEPVPAEGEAPRRSTTRQVATTAQTHGDGTDSENGGARKAWWQNLRS
jgi:hypothetical protein